MSAVPHHDELELLDAKELAELLHLPVSFIRHATRKRFGKDVIPHLKIGKYVRFEEPAVRAWLDRRKKGYATARR